MGGDSTPFLCCLLLLWRIVGAKIIGLKMIKKMLASKELWCVLEKVCMNLTDSCEKFSIGVLGFMATALTYSTLRPGFRGLFFSPQTKLKWDLGQVGPKKLARFHDEELFSFFKTIKLSWSYLA